MLFVGFVGFLRQERARRISARLETARESPPTRRTTPAAVVCTSPRANWNLAGGSSDNISWHVLQCGNKGIKIGIFLPSGKREARCNLKDPVAQAVPFSPS